MNKKQIVEYAVKEIEDLVNKRCLQVLDYVGECAAIRNGNRDGTTWTTTTRSTPISSHELLDDFYINLKRKYSKTQNK